MFDAEWLPFMCSHWSAYDWKKKCHALTGEEKLRACIEEIKAAEAELREKALEAEHGKLAALQAAMEEVKATEAELRENALEGERAKLADVQATIEELERVRPHIMSWMRTLE